MADISLDDWVATVVAELQLEGVEVDVDQVLDLAGEAARAVIRPAAPLTTFLAGLAAGRAGGGPQDVTDAVKVLSALCARVGDSDA